MSKSNSAAAEAEAPAIPLVAAAPAPLTPAELEAGEVNFKNRINELLNQEIALLKSVLMLNWDKGNFCIDMQNDPKRFANHKPADLAKALDVSESSVFKYVDFARSYTKGKVAEMASLGIPWRAVASLLSVNSPEKRAVLEAKLTCEDEEKRLSSDALQEKVAEINAKERAQAKDKGAKISNRGGPRPIVTIRTFAGLLKDVLDKQEAFKQAYTEFKKLPADPEQKETRTEIQNAFKTVKQVGEAMIKLDDFRKRLAQSEK